MKKIMILMAAIASMTVVDAMADDYSTAGNGTTWTLTRLADTDGTGVTREGNVFTLSNTVVVADGDHFELEGGITIQLEKGVSLEVDGSASMAPAERTLVTRSGDGVVPGIVYLRCENNLTFVKNVDFEYAGLKYYGSKGLCVDNCTFRYHEASMSNGSSALSIAGEGALFNISNCTFERNKRAAIGGAGNATNPTTIENCRFAYNDQQNLNYPQLNLTASSSIIVRNNVVTGDRDMTRGGGVMVADLLSVASDPYTLIENNNVTDNRYGIALYAAQKAVVRNNMLLNNDTETEPNNGGSGINVYDPTGKQRTTITGNHIEGHLWGVTIIGGADINLGKTADPEAEDYNPGLNTFYNNGNSGMVYDLYNNSSNTVYAQGNYWKTAATQDEQGIEDVIFHKHDNSALGEVIFMPFATEETVGIVTSEAVHGAVDTQVYTLSGARVNALQRGLNIVRNGQETLKLMRR